MALCYRVRMNEKEREKDLLWLFDFALILKIINGSLETLAALLVLFVPPSLVIKLAEYATSGELAQDPTDGVANFIRDTAHTFAIHTHYLLAAYLALHGIVKIVLVIGIFMKKKIAYPLFMIALALFGAYEAYRGVVLSNLLLLALSGLDLAILILTAYEYRRKYQPQSF